MPSLKNFQPRKVANRAKLAVKYEQLAWARRAPLKEHAVFYEAFAGNGVLCNPEAIFRALLRSDDLGELQHIWALQNLDEHAATIAEFADQPNVRFVERDTPAYYSALATSKYLINNSTFPPQFGKREGQIYVNTWHGTPIKAMGYDVPGGGVDTRNIARNFLSADYLLASNEAVTDMYLTAYKMRNIFRGRLVQEGSPRVDRQFLSDEQRAQVRERLTSRGVILDPEQQVILYAPTWKGNFYAPTNDIRQLRARVAELSALIDTSKYRLLLKVHQHVYRFAMAHKDMRQILVPNDIPTNEVLAATDVLVTDYSSIFIDFLATGRPVLFYTPDLNDYESARGLYLPLEDWPGPVCSELDELARHIGNLGSGSADDPVVSFGKAYAAARNRYCSLEDGKAADRVVDIVFRGRTAGYNVREDFSDGRTSILIHLGGMRSNGITSSALCLLDNIDYSRYDVSATFTYSASEQRLRLVRQINPNVRLLPRLGGINGSKLQVFRLLGVRNRSAHQVERSVTHHRQLLRDEWVRCFGTSQFDHVVDFSGYAPLWVQVFSQRGAGSLSIWLHNDMHAEMNNSGKSAYHRASVAAMSALYKYADQLVSVSPALSDVNREKFADAAPAEKFVCARNTINYARVLQLAYGMTVEDADVIELGTKHTLPEGELPPPRTDNGPVEQINPRDLRGVVARLIDYHGVETVFNEVERRSTIQLTMSSAGRTRTFVTAGRLSTEKNHERLIRAFDLVHQEYPDTKLLILGSGTLKERLERVIDELGLTSAVDLAGYFANPYGVLAHSDCFVLSSDYEGQPMVLLEALVLGLPVITTDFGSVRGSMPEGHGLIVARKVRALADGMRAFLRGDVQARPFDYVGYNREATEEFYRAIGAG